MNSIDEFLSLLELSLVRRYHFYLTIARNTYCKIYNKNLPLLDFEPFNINFSALKEALSQTKTDIKIIELRRGSLIGDMRMSEGKIAGAIVYRLTKAQVIHIHRKCNNCAEKCFARANILIAVRIGLDYIHKNYTELPREIRNELIYTIKNRHINQETLGLVFDTFVNS